MGFSIFSFLEAERSQFTLRLIDVKWLSLLDWIIMNNYDQGSTKREPEEATPWSQMVSQIRNTRCLILSIYLLYLPCLVLIVRVLKVQLEQGRRCFLLPGRSGGSTLTYLWILKIDIPSPTGLKVFFIIEFPSLTGQKLIFIIDFPSPTGQKFIFTIDFPSPQSSYFRTLTMYTLCLSFVRR